MCAGQQKKVVVVDVQTFDWPIPRFGDFRSKPDIKWIKDLSRKGILFKNIFWTEHYTPQELQSPYETCIGFKVSFLDTASPTEFFR